MKKKNERDREQNAPDQYYRTETDNYARLYITRPDIDYKRAFLCAAAYLALVIILSCASALLLNAALDIGFAVGCAVSFLALLTLVIVIKLDKILIWLVKVYQSRARIETRLRCCFQPSCSDYAILAIKKYGAIRGSIKAFRRIKRCSPPGGVDYP